MRILFAISVLAFVALLWASLSAAQYIRRARRRRSAATQPNATINDAVLPVPPEISGLEVMQTDKGAHTSPAAASKDPEEAADTSVPPPAAKPEWGYFSHDAGDLSDPAAHRPARLRRQS